MTWYFDDPDQQAILAAACATRAGTPFREGMSSPGEGYDCAHFVRDVFRECGVDTSAFDACPQIALNAGRLSKSSLLLDWLREIGRDRLTPFAREAIPPLLCGDILAIRERLSCNHLALCESAEWAWHIPFGGVVSRVPVSLFRPSGRDCIEMIFRLKA
jgi:hypothetical protein